MKYKSFEEVPVWQAAVDLAAKVFVVTEDKAFRFRGDIANQIQRAALSISNNIAEGFERGTTQELITFLYYAKGSAGEVRSVCHVIDRLSAFDHLKSEISDMKSLAVSVSRQLNGWAGSLQNTDIAGHRYLNDRVRSNAEQEKRWKAFREEGQKVIEENIRRTREQHRDK
jgi:four helix bundle protein